MADKYTGPVPNIVSSKQTDLGDETRKFKKVPDASR